MVRDDRLGPDPVPFGFQYDQWRTLVDRMEPTDELWEFSSSVESWRALAGRRGICLVRDGRIVDSIITMMS